MYTHFQKQKQSVPQIAYILNTTPDTIQNILLQVSEKGHAIDLSRMHTTVSQNHKSIILDALDIVSELGVQVVVVWELQQVLLRLQDALPDYITPYEIRYVIAEQRQNMMEVDVNMDWEVPFCQGKKRKIPSSCGVSLDEQKTKKSKQDNSQMVQISPPSSLTTLYNTSRVSAPSSSINTTTTSTTLEPVPSFPTTVQTPAPPSRISTCMQPKESVGSLLKETKLGQYMHTLVDMDPSQLLHYFHQRRREHELY